MAEFIRSDLEFILEQIRIAEAHVINGMLNGEVDVKKIDEVNSVDSITEMVTSMQVYEAEKLVEQVKEEELQRELFWKKQYAAGVRHHMLLSDTASQ